MNVVLWILQVLLGLAFVAAGYNHAFRQEAIKKQMAWMEDFSSGTITFIGVAEILGGIGLVLPALTNILPVLTPLAAVGLTIIMILAAITHFRRGETSVIVINLVLGALAAFIAYGRFVLVPFV
jgi:uncharacterized membrane protein YphA (DoxX/SURF4 family)